MLNSDGLVQLLGVGTRNHTVIANNLANLNTPGYRTQRLEFTKELENALDEKGDLRPGLRIDTRMHAPGFSASGPGGNDVSLAREIVELNKNALKMQMYLAVLGGRIRKMRYAIDGR